MSGAAFRGQPLLLIAFVVLGWLSLRAMLWQSPFAVARVPTEAFAPLRATAAGNEGTGPPPAAAHAFKPIAPERGGSVLAARATALGAAPADAEFSRPPLASERPQRADDALLSFAMGVAPVPPVASVPRISVLRWSGDAWLFVRPEATSPAAGVPGYGRSQAGAVLRYRLAHGRTHAPQAYLRAAAALSGAREQVLAAGLSLRPVQAVPMRIAAEAGLTNTSGAADLRPAVYAVTELAPIPLPGAMRGEAYVQAGYVGGPYATAFVDGQARIDRAIAPAGAIEVRGGGGVWFGAQEGATRFDFGPTLAVTFPLVEARGRLSADYRFRLAGDAAPASGPALTLSAGF